jgi:hypothetical protein
MSKHFYLAASPSARRLQGAARVKVVEQQRRRWSTLSATFEPGEMKRLAAEILTLDGVATETADSDDWLAAAQTAYNHRAGVVSRRMYTHKDNS